MTFADFLARVDNCGAEYYYVMRDDVWYTGCLTDSKLVPLAEALNRQSDGTDYDAQQALSETLGLAFDTPAEDLVARIAELDRGIA